MKVSRDRWLEAQGYERHTWMVGSGKDMVSDRNIQHAQNFHCYEVLDGVAFKRGIELGCGPFTNMRFIEPVCAEIKEIHLLDPLVNDYLGHTWCRYRKGLDVTKLHACTIEDFEWSRNSIFDKCPDRPQLYASAIEDFDFSPARFDLVVMINVLPHCMDSEAVFNKILEIAEPHAVLVFSEARIPGEGDRGHPLRSVPFDDIMGFLNSNFRPLFLDGFEGLAGEEGRQDVYFIGQRI